MREMFSDSETLCLPGQNFGDLEVRIWILLLQHSCWQRSFEGTAQAQQAFTCSWWPCWHYRSIHLFHILMASTSFNNLYSSRRVSLKSISPDKSLVSKHCVLQFVIWYSKRGHFARCLVDVGWEIALISRHVWFRGSEWLVVTGGNGERIHPLNAETQTDSPWNSTHLLLNQTLS